ncbi:MAG: hypothetical protein SWO11_12170 [Thermodesulfobacteriota bacterium]|nr:hypothetical protein [Thermodesulfobacteriota bacterium]
MNEVAQAIAAFERTIVAGYTPFDRWYFGSDKEAMSQAAIRGLEVFMGEGSCVSCHVIEQTQALFTDNRFHNIGVRYQPDSKGCAKASKRIPQSKDPRKRR